ncbi:MAG TPA: hypothetical protein VLT59_14435, partial [Steroidobacteraceae bacterium]|nr:hypothetical protein [Steroidobacteraceae bacterium]
LGASASLAQAQNDSGDWRQTVFVYGMGAMIEGDSQVGPLQVPVDVSMSDFFDSLDFGAMLAYRLANDEWSFSGDVTYMDLGFRRNTEQGRAGAGLNTEQVTVMATVGRRIRPNLEALLSLAYFDLSADLSVRVLQQTATVSRSVDWVDPLIGLNYDVPLSSRWRFTLRGDIGGFGFGSDLTWHALTKFTYQSSDRFGWYVGYRVIAYDYEEGQGLNYQRYDLRQHGPGLGLSYSF